MEQHGGKPVRSAATGTTGARTIRGVHLLAGFLDLAAQTRLLAEVAAVMEAAPPMSPVTRWGKPLSVAMTSAGRYGWWSDRRGYAYVDRHPGTGLPFPPIPATALAVWNAVVPGARQPDCCLINLYAPAARMGLHQDRDEADFDQPVVSISLGDDALFRLGNLERGGRTESTWLRSGDVAVLEGPARLIHHGVDRIAAGTSPLPATGALAGGGRINLTLRVAR